MIYKVKENEISAMNSMSDFPEEMGEGET